MFSHCKRLIEVDLPIRRISGHALRERNRQGHISSLHIWWARRPLAACRAVICAALWPDPADEDCPELFREVARKQMLNWACEHLKLAGADSAKRLVAIQKSPSRLDDLEELRATLLDFIADFANWDNSTVKEYLDTCRALTQAGHEALGGVPGGRPLVVDPFAGGGSIPFEALRIGADAFGSDLNPVAVLLNKILLEYIPKYGNRLAQEVRSWGEWTRAKAEEELSAFYPITSKAARPLAYIWARTVMSEAPSGDSLPIEVPLLKSMWLAQKGKKSVGMRWKRDSRGNIKTEVTTVHHASGTTLRVRRPALEIVTSATARDLDVGTVNRGAATCPITGFTTSVRSVREQLKPRHGGSSDARLCVVVHRDSVTAKCVYKLPTEKDMQGIALAQKALVQARRRNPSGFPDEELPDSASGYCAPPTYGAKTFSDLFSPRQLHFANWLVESFDRWARESGLEDHLDEAVRSAVALVIDRLIDSNSSQCWWVTVHGETVMRTFGRQAYPIVWDFAETNPLAPSSRGIHEAVEAVCEGLEYNTSWQIDSHGNAGSFPAQVLPLPEDSCSALVTDPPYYNAIPYADLADFYCVWLARLFRDSKSVVTPRGMSPKPAELVEMASWDEKRYGHKSREWYEREMAVALGRARLVTKPNGVMVLVFAHKETHAWEALLSAVVSSGWTITSSWPINTENARRLRAQRSATLESSVHLVCRPRENPDGTLRSDAIGDWRDVLRELPRRIHDWMPRLAEDGVVGADAIFACLGPALEVFSRYSRVEKASGEAVTLKAYLEEVWAAVSREALSMIFEGADASGFEEDARLTAMWLWTLQTAAGGEEWDQSDEDGDDKSSGLPGYRLEYDAARKIAQGLGANLENLEHLVEVTGETATLLTARARTKYLFGKEGATATRGRPKKKAQIALDLGEGLDALEEQSGVAAGEITGRPGATVLDRLHQAMVLFGAGRGEAVRRFLVEEGVGRNPMFWRLAQALSALYPMGSEEKRWIDGVLARKKGLGL